MLHLDEAQKEAFRSEVLRLVIDIFGEKNAEEFSAEEIEHLLNQLDQRNNSRIKHLVDNAHIIYHNIRPFLIESSPETEKNQELETEALPDYFNAGTGSEATVEAEASGKQGESPNHLEEAPASKSIETTEEIPLITLSEVCVDKLFLHEIDVSDFVEGSVFDATCEKVEDMEGVTFNKARLALQGTPTSIGDHSLVLSFAATGKTERMKINLGLRIIPDVENLPIPIVLDQVVLGEKFETELEVDRRFKYDFEMDGLEGTGLFFDNETFILSGIPEKEGEFQLCLNHQWEGLGREQVGTIDIALKIHKDPRTLWEVKDPDPGVAYPKVLDRTKSIKVNRQLMLVAASKRGRIHEHNAEHREDDFQVRSNKTSEWIVMAVADGANKAEFSRKGSELACKVAEQVASKRLEEKYKEGDDILENARLGKAGSEVDLHNFLKFTLTTAVYNAFVYIKRFATSENKKLENFGTTLRLTICKPLGSRGYFIASLAVGDGATAIYYEKGAKVTLLHSEESGPVYPVKNLLTIPEISEQTAELNKRVAYRFVEDFTAVMTMTNGVSDSVFGKGDPPSDPVTWSNLWKSIQKDVFASTGDIEKMDDLLLKWLGFWAPGEVDDRTLAILMSG